MDGFGTTGTYASATNPTKVFTNQVIQSWAVYKPPGAKQEFLYVGTSSHFDPGGEVWQYDGTGKNGWKNTSLPQMFPSRNMSMAVYDGHLYLAQGFPTGHLYKYDGTKWELVLSLTASSGTGPPPVGEDRKSTRLNSSH